MQHMEAGVGQMQVEVHPQHGVHLTLLLRILPLPLLPLPLLTLPLLSLLLPPCV